MSGDEIQKLIDQMIAVGQTAYSINAIRHLQAAKRFWMNHETFLKADQLGKQNVKVQLPGEPDLVQERVLK